MSGAVLKIVPAEAVAPDEPRWWISDDMSQDQRRLEGVRTGFYPLHTAMTAAEFCADTGRPDSAARAIVRREVAS